MANIIGGGGPGFLDSSLYLLNRNDTTGAGSAGHGEQVYIDISNGNLVLSHQDEFLPSETKGFITLRTYNTQGQLNGDLGEGWVLSEMMQLSQITNNQITLQNTEGSEFTFNFDSTSGVYRSVNGAGAYETITFNKSAHTYTLLQSNQTQVTFDKNGTLLQTQDTNGNTITYSYHGSNLISIQDNSGHTLNFEYQGSRISEIEDETGAVFARYTYAGNELISETDRAGETTSYSYYNDGTLQSVSLPDTQGEPDRTLQFTYAHINGTTNGFTPVLASMTDAQGNTTTFNYQFNTDNHNNFIGGTTFVSNAAGNVTTYSYNANGQITDVRDATGLDTAYTYDANQNLTSVRDANGAAIVQSNSTYYRNLRQGFGIVDATGQGKLVSQLTASDIRSLQAHFTTSYTYDGRGNLTSTLDGSGNLTTYTYTSFNKLATATAAEGNALVSSDAAQYIAKRQELGFINPATGQGKTVAQLTAADIKALLAQFTTTYSYDAHQNITQIQGPGGDLIAYTYDSFGNLTQRTVYLDKTNLTDPTKQEVTQYSYDVFGNNVKTIDAQGNVTFAAFDHFGNRTSQIDGRGGVTTYTYDAENQLRTTTDPLGNTTVNFYDAVGNRIAVEDASGHTITYVYSANNQLLATINPSADLFQTRTRTTISAYDVMGNQTSTTDANGNTTTYSYDVLNRQVTVITPVVTNAAGNLVIYATRYAYDGVGNRITVIDNNGNQTSTVYNPNNLMQTVTDASGNVTQYAYDANLNQISIVAGAQLGSAAREILKFDYDAKNRLISATDAQGNTTHNTYDGANNRVSTTDANGNTTNYTYDRDNRVLTVTQPAVIDPVSGQSVRYVTTYGYDANGNQVAITDQNGHTTHTTFDKDNRSVLVQDANGIQTVFTYDSRGNRTSVQLGVQAHVGANGNVIVDSTQNAQVETYQYDEFNQVVAKTDGVGNALVSSDSALYVQMRQQLGIVNASGQGKLVAQLTFADIQALKGQFTEHYTYDRVGNYTSTTDHLGRTTTFAYDGLNRLVQTTDARGGVTRIAYDGNGNAVSRRDALGRNTTVAYDSMNRVVDTRDALGVDTHQTYDAFGNLISSTAASGTSAARTTTYVYDLDNRMIATTDAQGNTKRVAYDAVGNRLQVTDAKGQTTRYVYDAMNREIEIIDPLGFQTRMTYDGVGNRLSLIDAKGGITKFTYDAGNRQISIQDALGRVTAFTYDALGDRITQTTAAGTALQETTTYQYDAENHLRQVTDAAGKISTQNYDAVYNETSATDPNGNTTTYAYDALNRRIQVTNALGAVTSYAYDAVGNQLRVTDANGHVTTYAYDARNQMIAATDANGVRTTYAYDAVRNQVSITYAANTSAAATVTFAYDLDNRLIAQTDALGNTTRHQYDANGNAVAVTDPLGHAIHYTYDANNRLQSITDPLGNVTWYYYDGNGNRVQVEDARGFTTTTYFDADNEVVLAVDNAGYATGFAYDANGNLISQTLYASPLTVPADGLDPTVQPTPVASAADQTKSFTYDAMNWLISRTDGEGYVTQFVYDSVGNRIQTRQALDRAGTQFEVTHTYYDVANRQVANVTAQGYLTTYAYDAVGNRIRQTAYDQIVSNPANGSAPQPLPGDGGRTTTSVYDADNRLVQQTDARGAVTTHQYDARGNLIATTQGAGTASARTSTFQYDAANRYIATTDALGTTTSLVLDAAGNIVTQINASGTLQQRVSTFTYDAMNRTVSQTDPLGIVTQTAYDAVGNVISKTFAAGTAAARTSTSSYDGDSRQISSTDAIGAVTSFAYDAAGHIVRTTEAVGSAVARTTTSVYDRANRLVAETDALGVVTQYQYDGAGNQIGVTDAVGTAQQRQTSFTYDLDNRMVQSADALGRVKQFQYDAQGNQTQIIDAKGNVLTQTFDALGHELTSLSAGGVLTRNTFDLFGNLISSTHSFTNGSDARTTTYAYDLLNRQTLATDAQGFSTSTVYDAFGDQINVTAGQYLVSQSDPNYSATKAQQAFPQKTTYTYDADGRTASTTDALGQKTAFTYDAVGNRISTTDAKGNVSTSAYDLDNRLIAQTDALGNTQTKQYDLLGNLVVEKDALGHTTTYTYDADGRTTSTTDALGNVTRYTYDAVGNRVQVIDPRGFVSTKYYDADNEVVLAIDNDGYATSYTYDADGKVISQTLHARPVSLPVNPAVPPTVATDPLDRTAVFAYDGLNQVVSRTDGEGFVTQYQYDSAGNLIQTRQALDQAATRFEVTRNYYDANSQEVASVSAQGYLTTYRYDATGNRIAETQYNQIVSVPAGGNIPTPVAGDAGRTTTFAYDADNRLVQQTDALGVVTTYQYDANGNKVSLTEAAGTADARTTLYQYDAANRYIATTNALGITTRLDLDANGNVLARHDAFGTAQERVSHFTYDGNNRSLTETDPLGVVTTTTYDAAGNVQSKTVAAGTSAAETTSFAYDADGREISTTDATGTQSTFNYDAAGNKTQETQAAGLPEARTNTFTYDRADRLVSATDALGTITQYQYDGAGNRLATLQAAGTTQARQTSYVYDLDNRLISVTDPMGGTTSYQYDAQGDQTQITNANGAVTTNTFDALGRSLTSLSATGVLTTNSYDRRGNLSSTTQAFSNGSDARTTTYGYDLLNQQTRVTDGEGFSTTIGYDAFGNQVSVTRGQYLVSSSDPSYSAAKAAVASPQTNTFVYDADNRMLSYADALGNVTTYAYDTVGNRTSKTDPNGHTTQYSYDLLNRVTQTTTPDGGLTRFTYDHLGNQVSESQLQSGTAASGVFANQSFAYDANGRMISQTDALGVVTQYTYDRAGNLLSQTSAAGTSDARTVRYEYDLDNRRTADVDALGNRTTFNYDAVGNRIMVTDPLGNISHFYYNGVSQVTEVVDPTGAVNTFTYDSAGNRTQTRVYLTTLSGPFNTLTPPTPVASSQDRITTAQFDRADRVISQTASDGSVTNYTYDGVGNKLTESQFANTAAPHNLSYAYDADNRLVSFTDVDGTVTAFTYDAANNKLSQTISNASDPNPVRKTVYTYDANNRELSQTFDPAKLDITQSETYDHLGNVLTKTDADGHTATFTYDLNNRQVSQTDAVGNTATFTYDRVGNQITATDARGNTTTSVYDANNRLIEKIMPAVQIAIAGSSGPTFSTVNPTIQYVFDAAGNQVQTTDANGNTTTRYFDGNGRVTAQVTADGALTTFTYNGAGDELSQTLYMTLLSSGPQNPSVPPTPPAGSATEQITYQYDLLGRLTLTTYPPTQITTLTNLNTNNPTPVVVTESVTQRNVYDAYGNLVQSYDRNGNLTTNYYDAKGRRIATVDPLGYLTQWVYDDQGNEIQQLVYTQPLNPATVSPGTLPTPPSGEVYQTDIQYDAASRMLAEIAPQITAFDPGTQTSSPIRSTTTYTYDKAGNQLTRTLGFGTAQQVTEYSYYDAINRRIAFIDSGRVLSTYAYDASGNLTVQKRFFNAVPGSVDLTQLNGSTNFGSLVAADASHDEETDNTYDALNRYTQTSDVLVSGTLSKEYGYDAAGNRTYAKDEDGFITQASFDSMGRLAETIAADGSGTRYQYDAAGNRVLVFTGVISGGPPAVASAPAASLGSNGALNLSWSTSGTATKPVQTWVVYDTSSHSVNNIGDLSGYASRTPTQVSSQGTGKASINSLATGSTVFFRVITQDGAGNESWTAEQSLTIPPRFSTVAVTEPSSGTLVVTVNFDAGTTNQQLLYGSGGTLGQSAAFTLVSGNTYQATITGVTNAAQLSFALQWQDAAGGTFQSGSTPFANVADQIGTNSTVSQSSFTAGSNTTFAINVSTQVPSGTAQNLVSVQAELFAAGSNTLLAETAVAGSDSGLGFSTYNTALDTVNHLAAGTYTVVLTGVRSDGTSVELDDFNYTVGPSATSVTRTAVSWTAPPASAGTSQVVVIGGQVAPSLRDPPTTTGPGRIVATDPNASPSSSTDYAAFYGTSVSDSHQVAVSSTANGSNFDVSVQATLTANEAGNIGGDGNLHLAWRAAGGGTSFPNDVALTASGTGSFSTTLSSLAAGSYDLEVYYIDPQGRQVIVEWQRVDAATVNSTFTGHSLTVQAEETGGTITIDANGNVTATPGVYVGPVDPTRLESGLSLSLTSTGTAGGETTNGLSTGYFASDTYNALNYKISSNEGDGLVRNFGVDANGNVMETDLLGDPNNPKYNPANPITTFTAYDGRNRTITTFGAPVTVGGGSTLVRAVDHYAYNVLDKVTAHTDANNNTTQYVYNAQGTQIEQIDPYGNTMLTRVDQFGNVTATVDQLGNMTRTFYDLQGRETSQVDALGNTTRYGYDAFGRKVSQTDPDGNTQTSTYDQRDRLTSQTDALNNTVSYLYDGRNDRISTIYPQNERTDQVYDGLGRVIDTVVWLDGTPTHSQRAYDAYGNLISETDAMGRTKTHVYGAFGRLLEDIDEDGNIVAYAYDQYGRKTNQYDPTTVSDPTAASDPSGGKDIQTSYDAAGRITAINDLATKVSTTYTYDLLGNRLNEVITTPGVTLGSTTYSVGRNITYQYDRLGQLVSWDDAVTGENLNTQYDADGNIVRTFTNAGYDPLNQGGGNSSFVYVDHVYSYDADRRVMQELDETPVDNSGGSATIINGYTYDAAGNRLTWNNAGTVVSYQYDADNRVTSGSFFTGSDQNDETWTYDALSNVLSYVTTKNGATQTSSTSTYNTANRVVTSTSFTASDSTTQATTNTYDLSLRITTTTLASTANGSTSNFTYNHNYFGDGREQSVTAFGDAKGSSVSTYDVNKIQIGLNLGQGDNQSRPEVKAFIADNEGHILFQAHDDGSSSNIETDQYLYANGQPVGQEQHDVKGNFNVFLDQDSTDGKTNFALLQNLGASSPGANLTYTVHAGDSLQSIASVMYGNPSLWYVIAEANGLSASAQLKAGTQLLIPQTIQSGTITAANHQVYSQSQIVGSSLPNLKSPPPPSNGGCGGILAIIAIIVIVVVAVVVSVVTFGAGTAIAAALADAGVTGVLAVAATVAATAVVGAAVAALGSIVQQGILIAIGYQHSFSWKDVGAAAVSGAITGAAAGLGGAVKVGLIGEQFATYVKVADAALSVAAAASTQLIENGKITSWTSLAVAAVGGYAQGAQAVAQGAASTAQAAAQTAEEAEAAAEAGVGTEEAAVAAADNAANAASAASEASAALSTANTIATVSSYVSPWAQLAETYARNGSVTPLDWANAVGGTLTAAVTDNFGSKESSFTARLTNLGLQAGTSALVAGAFSLFDKKTAVSYLESSVGQEVGQFIGGVITTKPSVLFGSGGSAGYQKTQESATATSDAETTSEAPPDLAAPTTNSDPAEATVDDQNGNPTAPQDAPAQATGAPDQAAADQQTAPPGPQKYTVVSGDSYAKIAREYYGDERYAALIMAFNGVDPTYGNIHSLQIGAPLNLPDISTLSDSTDSRLLKAGGALISADQGITDRIAAARAQAAALAQQQANPTPQDQGPTVPPAGQTPQPDPQTSPQAAPQVASAPAPVTAPATPDANNTQSGWSVLAVGLLRTVARFEPGLSSLESYLPSVGAPSANEQSSTASVVGYALNGFNNGIDSFGNKVVNGVVNAANATTSYISNQYNAFEQGGIGNTVLGTAYNGVVNTANNVSNFVSQEYTTATTQGLGNTQTAAFLGEVGQQLQQQAQQALTPGTSNNLLLTAVSPLSAPSVFAYNVATQGFDKTVSDYQQAAGQLSANVYQTGSNIVQSTENYFNTHTGNQIAYNGGFAVGEELPKQAIIFAATEGAGTLLDLSVNALRGAELVEDTAKVVQVADTAAASVDTLNEAATIKAAGGELRAADTAATAGDVKAAESADEAGAQLGGGTAVNDQARIAAEELRRTAEAAGFDTTQSVEIAGKRAAGDLAPAYENAVRDLYGGDQSFATRSYRGLVDGELQSGVADGVTEIAGKETAVDAKFVANWDESLSNPDNPVFQKPWAQRTNIFDNNQQTLIDQAQKYSTGFEGGVIYHTNSIELANYYTGVFNSQGITNFKFVITPAVVLK